MLTSGNVSDEPIAYLDGEAVERLGGIADWFLVHDRPIRAGRRLSGAGVPGAEAAAAPLPGFAPSRSGCPGRSPPRPGLRGRAQAPSAWPRPRFVASTSEI